MSLQVILAIGEPALRGRIIRMLLKEGVVIETVNTRAALWERLLRKRWDLVVTSSSIVPEPDCQRTRLFHRLPGSPMCFMLSEADTPAERARFLAAGFCAVPNANMSDEELERALAVICTERRKHVMALSV